MNKRTIVGLFSYFVGLSVYYSLNQSVTGMLAGIIAAIICIVILKRVLGVN